MFTPGSQLPQDGMSQITKPGEDLLFKLLQNIPAEKWVQGEQNAAKTIGDIRMRTTSPTEVSNASTIAGMLGGTGLPVIGNEGLARAAGDVNPALGAVTEAALNPLTYIGGGAGGITKASLPALGGVAKQAVGAVPAIVNELASLIKANPKMAMGITAGGVGGADALQRLMTGGFSPQASTRGKSQVQRQTGQQQGFVPGVASGIAGNLQKQQEQAVGKSAQQQGVSPQELLMRIAKAILMQGGGGASVDQIADLIYKSGALGQQDKYREAQIQEMGSREARTNAAIQMSRQNIEEKYNNAMMMANMNPGDQKLAEAARKAREERDAKLAEFDQRVYGAQQAGAK